MFPAQQLGNCTDFSFRATFKRSINRTDFSEYNLVIVLGANCECFLLSLESGSRCDVV